MKYSLILITVIGFTILLSTSIKGQEADSTVGYVIKHETSLLKAMKSPHNGTGSVKGGDFFGATSGLDFVLRERRLQNGGSLGKHTQKNDEVYFIVSGEGTIYLNDTPHNVKAGDAILTRKGSSHGIVQTSKEDLVILVIFGNQN